MPAQRVIPGGTKRNQRASVGSQHFSHSRENRCRIFKVLKSVDRNDDVGRLWGRRAKSDILASRARGGFAGNGQPTVHNVDAVYLSRPALSHLDSFAAGATAEINDCLVPYLTPDFLS